MSEPYLGKEELESVSETVKTGWISSNGHFIKDFEARFASYIGTRHGVSVCNGTAAIHLALAALGIGKGDEVILPSITSIACANSIAYTGAKAVFADSDKDYWCISPEDISRKITKRTKAIMVVHIYGHPCDMDPIMEIAEEKGIPVMEDCAEAHGAEYKGRKVGNFSAISCFSFYGNKIITTGEGGICLTDDDKLAEKMSILRNQGTRPEYRNKYYYDIIGFNYRMTNVEAAIGLAQMGKLEYLIEQKRRIAKEYNKLFASHDNVTVAPEMPWAKNVYWYYSILVKEKLRDKTMKELEAHNIESRPFFYPIHMLPHFKTGEKLRNAEHLGFAGINLPSGPQLTSKDIKRVVDTVLSVND